MVTRRYHSVDADRQAQAEADDNAQASDRIGHLIALEETADAAVDEQLIRESKAFCVGRVRKLARYLYLFRAAQALTCFCCADAIAVDDLFSSVYACEPNNCAYGYCRKCRTFRLPKDVKR